jgi:hypothetical protein
VKLVLVMSWLEPVSPSRLLHIRVACLQGRDVAAIDSSGNIIASSDMADALARRAMTVANKQGMRDGD